MEVCVGDFKGAAIFFFSLERTGRQAPTAQKEQQIVHVPNTKVSGIFNHLVASTCTVLRI